METPSRLASARWEFGIAQYRRGRPGRMRMERLIGTSRRDCLDQVLIFGEAHLRGVLTAYSTYYNETRTHLGLWKDTPLPRPVQRSGAIVAMPILSGLH